MGRNPGQYMIGKYVVPVNYVSKCEAPKYEIKHAFPSRTNLVDLDTRNYGSN